MRPCERWVSGDFLTESPTLRVQLKNDCMRCDDMEWCRQQAADAPVRVQGVWGGLLLPQESNQLPAPRTVGAARLRPGYEGNADHPDAKTWRHGAVDPSHR